MTSRAPASNQALVVSAHGRHALIEVEAQGAAPTDGASKHGERIHAMTRGKRSDVVVGDHVVWTQTGDQAVIERVVERRNLMHRQDEWRTKSFAANVDQVLLLVAVEPTFGDGQLSRSLIAAADAGIPAHILCNKIDLPGAEQALARLQPYAMADVDVTPLALKARPDEARAILLPLLRGKVTLVIGPSGVGKSSLINLIVPDAEAQVGELSQALQAGKHTTTATRWYWVRDEASSQGPRTALIDTPGFQQFGLHHIAADRLASLMPDIQRHATNCRFYNCTHRAEPGCGVVQAVTQSELSARRHAIYLELLDEAQHAATQHR